MEPFSGVPGEAPRGGARVQGRPADVQEAPADAAAGGRQQRHAAGAGQGGDAVPSYTSHLPAHKV